MKCRKFKFHIPVNEIRQNDIKKKNELSFEEQTKILKEEKTTTEKYIIRKDKNLDIINEDIINEDIVEEKKNPFSNLNPKKIYEDREKIIQEKMKEIKGNYTESEKRDMVLIELKTTTNYMDIKQENDDKIDIEFIKKKVEDEINKRIAEINSNESYYEKRLYVLNQMSTKKDYMNKEEINQPVLNNQTKQLEILNEKSKNLDGHSSINITADSTFQDSKEYKDQLSETSKNSGIFNIFKKKLKIFNEARAQHYLKHKIYDDLLTEINPTNQDLILPEIYKIDDTHYIFVYENTLKTYPITLTHALELTQQIIKISNLDEPFGIHFCGKKVKLKGEIELRECAPNNFICKECMEKNKKRYNLPDDCLINIIGRVSKNIKGMYHCIGTFVKENNGFDYCKSKFTCKACEILNLCKDYYNLSK
jgi:hypothetical protein